MMKQGYANLNAWAMVTWLTQTHVNAHVILKNGTLYYNRMVGRVNRVLKTRNFFSIHRDVLNAKVLDQNGTKSMNVHVTQKNLAQYWVKTVSRVRLVRKNILWTKQIRNAFHVMAKGLILCRFRLEIAQAEVQFKIWVRSPEPPGRHQIETLFRKYNLSYLCMWFKRNKYNFEREQMCSLSGR